MLVNVGSNDSSLIFFNYGLGLLMEVESGENKLVSHNVISQGSNTH